MFLVIFFALHSYVGEWEGLTADKHFEMSLKRQWNVIKRVQLPNFGNQISEMFVFERKQENSSSSKTVSTTDTPNPYVKHDDHTNKTAIENKVQPPTQNKVNNMPEFRLLRCNGCARTSEEASLSNRKLKRCLYCRQCVYCSKKCFTLCTSVRNINHAMRCIFFKEKTLHFPSDFTSL
jgi:hypothetical protein